MSGGLESLLHSDDDIHSEDDDTTGAPTDLDGDGYSPDQGDCNDYDPSVYPGAAESCNGSDEDCDGLIDEGFADSDQDGIADCLDDDCETDDVPMGGIEITPQCRFDSPGSAADPWDIVEEWRYSGGAAVAVPAVGNLTDDNEDGLINESDVPEVVLLLLEGTSLEDIRMVALHGDGSGIRFELTGDLAGRGGLVLADVNTDGQPEIVTVDTWNAQASFVAAYSSEGIRLWESELVWNQDLPSWAWVYPHLTAADLDGDGTVEIVTMWGVYAGSNGDTLFEFPEAPAMGCTPVVADLDMDGTLEIIICDTVYSHEGTVEWDMTAQFPTGEPTGFHAAVADLQGDEKAEVVIISETCVFVFSDEGMLLAESEALSDSANGATVADVDGDGQPEVVASTRYSLVMLEADLSVGWRKTNTYDASGAAMPSAFDFDGDGAYEILVADEQTFSIRDGTTGDVLYSWAEHSSVTVYEYPVVADVDSDGSAEIVVACNPHPGNPDCSGAVVFGHASNDWPPAGPYWGIHDFAPFRIRPDGRVQSPSIPPWQIHNLFRARPPGDGMPDLFVITGEACVASCEEGPVKMAWGIGNQGHVNVLGTVSAALYGDVGGAEVLLDVQTVGGAQYAQQTPGGTFELTPEQWGDGIRIVVDDDGTGGGVVDECDEGNNIVEILGPICG